MNRMEHVNGQFSIERELRLPLAPTDDAVHDDICTKPLVMLQK